VAWVTPAAAAAWAHFNGLKSLTLWIFSFNLFLPNKLFYEHIFHVLLWLILTNWLQTSVQTYKWTSQVKEKILKRAVREKLIEIRQQSEEGSWCNTPKDILVSFDVEDLFLSILMNVNLELLKRCWMDNILKYQYVNLAMVSMELNYFQFNGKFYEKTEETAMGNASSPFLTNILLSNFEAELKQQNLLSKVWVRY
jgi:hypothetical protein